MSRSRYGRECTDLSEVLPREISQAEAGKGRKRKHVSNTPRRRLSSSAHDVLWRAVEESLQLGHAAVSSEHILLALMHAKRAELFDRAEAYGRSYLSVRRKVAVILASRANRDNAKPSDGPSDTLHVWMLP